MLGPIRVTTLAGFYVNNTSSLPQPSIFHNLYQMTRWGCRGRGGERNGENQRLLCVMICNISVLSLCFHFYKCFSWYDFNWYLIQRIPSQMLDVLSILSTNRKGKSKSNFRTSTTENIDCIVTKYHGGRGCSCSSWPCSKVMRVILIIGRSLCFYINFSFDLFWSEKHFMREKSSIQLLFLLI